ncbi:hypothetical protein EDD18DRAFT_1277814 [Armillaria luteobubalina]|uniref:Uncharacterized protein n=1 Tax=Armillaria luteobubalina TaxID=153913 RepID=A0AA39QKN2_9AGAR|nr:hypothetical protein EDD18DRAFT_1277814 [Armillaria luteobubalina]
MLSAVIATVFPASETAFRKTITSLFGNLEAVCAKIAIVVDDAYTLYVNGGSLKLDTDFHAAQVYSVPSSWLSADRNVFAVDEVNNGGPVGVIATILVAYTDGTAVLDITHTTWKKAAGDLDI